MVDINSSDSDSDAKDPKWVFYRSRPEWSDITPIPQDDGPNPVVRIAYSDKFRDVYDYFRAVLEKNEISERALQLTADAIQENSANYTVWSYRRTLINQLGKDLNQEIDYISKIIAHNPKNYQVWYHRQRIIALSRNATNELDFTARLLKKDAKNYHAWQHRQWVLLEFKGWAGELEFVDALIQEDPKNNSAWNQRYFVVSNTIGFDQATISNEYHYVTQYLTPDNESPYNYLRGILSQSRLSLHEFPDLLPLFESLHSGESKSRLATAFLLEIYLSKLPTLEGPERSSLIERSVRACEDLATRDDTIRANYWSFQKNVFLQMSC